MPGYFPYDVEAPPRASGLVAERVTTPLGRVRVLRPGSGIPTTMFLHGVSLDSDCWTPLVRASGRDDLPWLLVDLPGFGGSDPLPGPISLDAIGDAVLAVLDGVGAGAVHLVGHSMGGFLGLHLAARHPDRVRTLATLNGTYVTILDLVNDPVGAALRHPRTWATYQGVRLVAGGGRLVQTAISAGARSGLLRWGTPGLAARPSALPGSLLRALAEGGRPRSFRYAEATGRGYDWRSTWRDVRAPVLAGFGDRDRLVTAYDARSLREVLPAAHQVVLGGTSHLSPMERPDDWITELDRLWSTG